jgi:hypothetical protein
MRLFGLASLPDAEPEDGGLEVVPSELPTPPAVPRANSLLYDAELHELVGKVLAAVAREAERNKRMRAELREVRIEVRKVAKHQTGWLGALVVLAEFVRLLIERLH